MKNKNTKILVTGSEGLIGSALTKALISDGFEVAGLDIRSPDDNARGDVRDSDVVTQAVESCTGIIHLAALSRVIWSEHDPELCWSINVDGTRRIINAAVKCKHKPWILFASSREVYGQPKIFPVSEDHELIPVNIYGCSKVAGERMMLNARDVGLRTAIARLSNVYGSTKDYPDRVVTAFAFSSVLNRRLRVDGMDFSFDFTHIDDTTRGLVFLVRALNNGKHRLPPIHLLTGIPTTLGELATMAIELADTSAHIEKAAQRSFDVSRFYGTPDRAREILAWVPRITIREGLMRLINDFRTECEALIPIEPHFYSAFSFGTFLPRSE